jgi:PAS domain S-box-containing protein
VDHAPLSNLLKKDPKEPTSDPAFLSGGGEMGELIRAKDWSKTALGPVNQWPQSLTIILRIMLNSRYAMWLGWGPDFTFFYNDAYAKMTLGPKHPWALGRSAREVWSEIWGDIGPRAESVIRSGQATWDEGLLLFLERKGFPEETYHTFSYSPIPDERGGVGGMLCVVTEDTERTISERRLRTLRELLARTSDEIGSAEDACQIAADILARNPYDLPFVVIYLLDTDGTTARLAGFTALPKGSLAAPSRVDLSESGGSQVGWPLRAVLKSGRAEVVAKLDQGLGPLPGGAWPESPQCAVVLPMAKPGQTQPAGFVVTGVSPRLEFTDHYKTFMDLLASHIATAVANARAYEEERKRAEALAELDRAKTAFFSNVSHELRTPLTLMLGPLEQLKAEFGHATSSLDVSQYQQLDLVHRNGLRLLKLVNQLLDFSRIEAGRAQAVYEETDLAALTTDLASVFRSAIEKAGLSLIVDCPPLSEPVFVDRGMWEKIVLNLLSNAFKFTFNGEIAVSLKEEVASGSADSGRGVVSGKLENECAELSGPESARHVILTVRDTGTGIPDDQLGKIFERFHRVAGSQGRTYEGTGIGLSLVQELARLHGGSVSVESRYGKGSTFRVFIPLGKSHLPHQHIGATHGKMSTASGAMSFVEEAARWLPSGESAERSVLSAESSDLISSDSGTRHSGLRTQHSRPRVLLADDNADMREYVGRLLRSRFEVLAAADGQVALEAARADPPDVVLTDIMMPRLDGFGLLRALRDDPTTRMIPVILLSARAGEESRVEGLEQGADDYLIKPFSAQELLARVETHVKMARMRRDAEAALREGEARFREMIDALPAAIYTTDAEGRLTHFNPAAVEFSGRVPELGTDEWCVTWKLYYPDGTPMPHDQCPMAIALKENRTVRGAEAIAERPDGTRVWFMPYPTPLRDAKGNIVGGVNMLVDITERKRAEEATVRLSAIVQSSDDAIISKDLRGIITSWNKGAEKVFGYTADEAIGKPVTMLFPPDRTDEEPRILGRIARGETLEHYETVRRRKDGTDIHISLTVSPIRDEAGTIRGASKIARDITERKRNESLLVEQKHLMEQIASGSPLDEILTELCLTVPKLNPRARACILLADEQRKKISGSITPDVSPAFGAALQDAPINGLCVGTCGEAVYSGKPVMCADVTKDERGSKMWRDLCQSCGIFAGYSKPILGTGGLPLASFFLCFSEPHQPDAWELKLAEFGAHVAGIAIERDRVEKALRESRRQLADELAAMRQLQDVSTALIREDNVQSLYERILDAAMGIMRSNFASLQMLYPDRGSAGELHLLAHRGFTSESAEAWEWVGTDSNCICGEALRTGGRVIVQDFESCDFMAGTSGLEGYRNAGIRAAQSTLLYSRAGKVLGMISTHWCEPHQPSERDLRLFDVLARQAADLIERKQAEEALRVSEEETKRARDYAEATLRTSPVPLLVLGKDLRVNTANEAFYHTFQVGTAETQGRLVYELGNGQWNIPKLRELLESILSQHTVFKKFEVTHDFESIGRRTMLLNARRMENEPDTPERIVLVIDDITERKQAEEALRRLNDELEQRVTHRTRDLVQSQDRLRTMATELNLAEQRERKRLATELHDHLQQTLVLGRLLVGQGKRAAAPVPACFDVMKKMDDILSEALTYTRTLVADLSPPVLRDHGLMAGLKWLGEYMKKHQITVTVTVPETDDLKLPEDQVVLLFQSVRELLINSSKHAGTREADVRLERYDGQLRIEVSDQGVGFDLAAAAAAAAGTPSGGISSKFGLFSIQERMRALGGTFDVQSAPGRGTTATLALPIRSSAENKVLSAELSGKNSALKSQDSALRQHSKIRVLLVDDHPMMRQGLRSIVTAYDHLEVVGEAGDGMEAVELAKRLDPDVVVMDIDMPKMDGIEATQQIKANHPATVVIGLSVNQSADTEQKMKAAGAFAYLTKESAVDALCHAIEQAVLSKRHTAACPVY